VSHLPRFPPVWARIPSDPDIPAAGVTHSDLPASIELDEESTCCCTRPRRCFDPVQPKQRLACIIYGLAMANAGTIEVQACKSCNRRWIGPDCRSFGLFNWNNRIIFTHDLLDEYTSAFTSSETPFTAWVTVVSHRYTNYCSAHPFVSEYLFRAAWFAYAKLQGFTNDMSCPTCGPSPENTIWDGITLAFHRKHLIPSLQPPTTINEHSLQRDQCRYLRNQQCLLDKHARKLVHTVITSRPHNLKSKDFRQHSETESDDVTVASAPKQDARTIEGASKYAEAVTAAISKLREVNVGVEDIFTRWYGPETFTAHKAIVPVVYKQLFLQVGAFI
jgi:hypothetical protein